MKRIDFQPTNVILNGLTEEILEQKYILPAIQRKVNVRFDLYTLDTPADHECYQIGDAEREAFAAKLENVVAKYADKIRLNHTLGGMSWMDHHYTIIQRSKK